MARKKVDLLSQNSTYVRNLEFALKKMHAWVNKYKYKDYGTVVDRIENALISQMDRSFEDILNQWDNLDGKVLIKKLAQRERDLIKSGRLILGTEGDHPMAINTATMLKNFSIKKRLQVMENMWSLGGWSGVGPGLLRYLSKASHIGGPNVPIGEVISHVSPFATVAGSKVKANTKVWGSNVSPSLPNTTPAIGKSKKELLAIRKARDLAMKGDSMTPFNRNLDVQTAARRLYERSFLPQHMLTEAAYNRPAERQARNFYRKLFGRDIFKYEKGSKEFIRNKKLVQALPFTFNDVVSAIDKGEALPSLDDDAMKVFNALKTQRHIPEKVIKGVKIAFSNPTVRGAARWGGIGLGALNIAGLTGEVYAGRKAITGKTTAERFKGTASGTAGLTGLTALATKNPTLGLYSGAISGGLMLGDALVENRKARDKEKNERLNILAQGPTHVEANTASGNAELKQWDQTRWEKAVGIFQRSQRRWNNFIDR